MSTAHESPRKAALVAQVRAMPGAYARRVEDKYAVGVLDLIIKFPNLPIIFAEGKYIMGQRNVFAPTLRQYEEGKMLWAAGFEPLLIGWREEPGKRMQMYICPWCKEADIHNCFSGPGTDTKSAQTLREFWESFSDVRAVVEADIRKAAL